MFVQIHTLRDYSTALPNRGQDGLAKRTIYGGVERQRISSQCFKAALRDCLTLVRTEPGGGSVTDNLCDLADSLGISMSVRSGLIGERKIKPGLVAKGLEAATAEAWADAIMGLWRKSSTDDGSGTEEDGERGPRKKGRSDTDEREDYEKKAQPIVIGNKEIEALVDTA